jgi:GntR family carbon starvation induced transcriptional regulator
LPTSLPSVSRFTAPGTAFPGDPRKTPTLVVAFWLWRDIVRGVFEPGERLKVQLLSRFYEIGHTPIREAIARLLATGLVVHEQDRGHRVALVSVEDYTDVLDIFLRLRRLALDMAVARGDEAWEARMVAQLHRSLKARPVAPDGEPEARELWQRAYGDLQRELVSGCRSPALLRMLRDIGARAERYGNLFGDYGAELQRDHAGEQREMVGALIARDGSRVHALLDASDALAGPLRTSVIEELRRRAAAVPIGRRRRKST